MNIPNPNADIPINLINQFANLINIPREIGEDAAFWRTCPVDIHAEPLIEELEITQTNFYMGHKDIPALMAQEEFEKFRRKHFDGLLRLVNAGIEYWGKNESGTQRSVNSLLNTLVLIHVRVRENLGEADEHVQLAHPPP